MPERKIEQPQQPGNEAAPVAAPQQPDPWSDMMTAMGRGIDQLFMPYQAPDSTAMELARRTPAVVVICLVVLFAGIIGSRLDIWTAPFLWGIPSLGATGLGFGLWIWCTSLAARPDLSDEVRERLRRAMQIQVGLLVVGVLALAYFLGMALALW